MISPKSTQGNNNLIGLTYTLWATYCSLDDTKATVPLESLTLVYVTTSLVDIFKNISGPREAMCSSDRATDS